MRRELLVFFMVIDFVLVGCFLYFWGGGLAQSLGQNLSLKFYNGVLNIYIPGLLCVQDEGGTNVYQDVTASMYPAIAYNEEQLWYEAREEDLSYYENLAAMENLQAMQMIAENEEALEKENMDQKGKQAETETEDKKPEENRETEKKEKKTAVNRKKLDDYDYLRQTFFQIDNTTTIGRDQLNADKLLGPDLTIDRSVDGPQILIYHTHSQEGYKDSRAGDDSTTVVGVGDYLTQLLEDKGFQVLHHKGKYDVGDRDHAYSNAAGPVEQLIKENPSIQVVIDLHRDGVNEKTRLTTEINGKKTAQIMFFNGLSRTTATGDIEYMKNPYIENNLAFSFQMQLAAAETYPGFTRRIYLKGYRYNMHFCPKSMLVEVGAQTNTVKEAKNAMEPLAELLAKVLKKGA